MTFISPMQFGAAGDGFADDTIPAQLAIIEAARTGLRLEDERRTFAVRHLRGDSPFVHIGALSLRQLDMPPSSTSIRTLMLTCARFRIDQLTIDQAGQAECGHLNESAGLWAVGGEGHEVYGLDVFGDGLGSGAVFCDISNSLFEGLHAHDMRFSDQAATDDKLMGFVWIRPRKCEVIKPRVHRLTGDAAHHRWTRGLAVSGAADFIIKDMDVSDVDQGADVTGDKRNFKVVLEGGTIERCGTHGAKLANAAVECLVRKMTIRDCGTDGVVVSGPSQEDQEHRTQDCLIEDVTVHNTGSNDVNAGTPAAFRLMTSRFHHDYPKNITLRRCKGIDDQPQPTMLYGFHNESSSPGLLEECESVGHVNAATWGAWTGTIGGDPAAPVVKHKGKEKSGGCLGMIAGLSAAAFIAERLA